MGGIKIIMPVANMRFNRTNDRPKTAAMYKAIIIDDERLCQEQVKKLLQEFPEVEVIGEQTQKRRY